MFVFFQYSPMTSSLLLDWQFWLLCFVYPAACLLFLGVWKAEVGSSTTVVAVSLIYISILKDVNLSWKMSILSINSLAWWRNGNTYLWYSCVVLSTWSEAILGSQLACCYGRVFAHAHLMHICSKRSRSRQRCEIVSSLLRHSTALESKIGE